MRINLLLEKSTKYIFAIGLPGCRKPPIIWTNVCILNPKPVIAYKAPKKRMEAVANAREMINAHLQRNVSKSCVLSRK